MSTMPALFSEKITGRFGRQIFVFVSLSAAVPAGTFVATDMASWATADDAQIARKTRKKTFIFMSKI